MPNKNEMQMWKCDLKIPCHVASCHGRAAWYIGKPEKRYDALIVCDKCASELASNIPSELLPKIEVVEEFDSLEELTVKELKEIAKEKGIKGYSKMNEAELIEAIEAIEGAE